MAFEVVASLDLAKSIAQINTDLKNLEKKLNKLKIAGTLNDKQTINNINSAINQLKSKISALKLNANLNQSNVQKSVNQALKNIKATVKVDADTSGIKDIDITSNNNANINSMNTGLANAVTLSNNLSTSFKDCISSFTGATLIYKGINEVIQAFQEAIDTVEQLDAKMTDLAIATKSSKDVISELMTTYNDIAYKLGSTTFDVSSAADTWIRQGYSVSDTNKLIEESTKLSILGQQDMTTSAKNLTTILKSYNIEATKSTEIVDKLTNLDMYASITAGELADGISKVAANANQAGINMDRLAGYLAVIKESTGESASSAGTSLNAMFSRMGNIKLAKLDGYDEFGEDISNVETVLRGLGIEIREDEGNFKDFGIVLDDINNRWDTFAEVSQKAIAKQIAGTHHINDFMILMQNYDTALKYMNISMDSAGTSADKYQIYMDSIQASANQLKTAFESLSLNTFNSDLLIGLNKTATQFIKILDNTGLVKGALVGLGTAGALKGISLLSSNLRLATTNLATLHDSLNYLKTNNITKLTTTFKGLTVAQQNAILSSNNLTVAQRTQLLTSAGLTAEEANLRLSTIGLSATNTTATVTTLTLSSAFNTLKVAILSNPIGAFALAITGVVAAISSFKQKQQELQQTFDTAVTSIKDEMQTLKDIESTYSKLSKMSELTVEDKQQLIDIQTQLNGLYGSEAEGIDLVNGKYDKQIEKLNQLSSVKRQQAGLLYSSDTANAKQDYYDLDNVDFTLFNNSSKYDDVVKKLQDVENVNYLNGGMTYTGFNVGGNDSVERVQALTDVANLLKENQLTETTAYNQIVEEITKYQDKIDTYNDKISIEANNIIDITLAKTNVEKGTSDADIRDIVDKATKDLTNDKVIDAVNKGIWDKVQNLRIETELPFDVELKIKNTEVDTTALKEQYQKAITDSYANIEKNISSFDTSLNKLTAEGELSNDIKTNLLSITGNADILNLKDMAQLYSLLVGEKEKYITTSKKEFQNNIDNLNAQKLLIESAISQNTTERNKISSYDNKDKVLLYNKAINVEKEKLTEVNNALSIYDALLNNIGSTTATTTATFEDLNSINKQIYSSVKAVSSAFAEYNSNGTVSLDTAISLIDSGYANILSFDNQTNSIKLNVDAYKSLLKLKIDNQIADLKLAEQTAETTASINALTQILNNIDKITGGTYETTIKTTTTPETDNTDYYKENAEAQISALKHEYEIGNIDTTSYYNQLLDLNKYYYEGKEEYLEQYRDYEKEVYDGLADAQKERLEAEKEKIQDVNDEQEKALELIKAFNEAENAKNNKTIKSYSEESGFNYVTNTKDILEKKSKLDQLIADYKNRELDKQISDIDKMSFQALREAFQAPITIPTNDDIMKQAAINTMESINNINNNQNNNQKSITINVGEIYTENATDFMEQLNEILKQGIADSIVGK